MRQSFCAAAHLLVQSGAWFSWSGHGPARSTRDGSRRYRARPAGRARPCRRSIRFPPRRERQRAAERNVRPAPAGCCSATTSPLSREHLVITRCAFRLIALRCVTVPPPLSLRRDRIARENPGFAPTARRTPAGRYPSIRESIRSNAGSAPRRAVSHVRFVIAARPHRAAAPSRCGSRSCRRCDGARGTPPARSDRCRLVTVPSLCASIPAKRWHSATSPSVETPISPGRRRTDTPCSRPCGSLRACP